MPQCRRLFYAGLILAFLLSLPVLAQNTDDRHERIMAQVREDARVKDILLDFPEVRLDPTYSAQWSIWIVKFMQGDRQLGLVTVDPENNRILEFSFDIDGILRGDHGDEGVETDEARGEEEVELFRSLLPRFHGMTLAWMSFVLVLVLIGNLRPLWSLQNLDILLVYALAPFLSLTWTHTKLAYTGLFVISSLLLLRCVWASRTANQLPQELNVRDPRLLWALLAFALMLHVVTLYERHIGDVGLWSAIGGEYLLRTGHLPYGTEFGPNCVYGPLMYVLFVPAGLFASYIEEIPQLGQVVLGEFNNWQAMRGVQSTELLLDLITLYFLYRVVRKQGDHITGLSVVFVYAISPYILGMVGELGLERASHIAGMPFILAVLLLLHRPGLAGLLLGVATGMLYYPLFLMPLYLGYLWRSQGRSRALVFLLSYAAVGLICVLMLLVMVQSVDEVESAFDAFIDDTIAQQQFKPGYGNSQLSFWGQYPNFAAWGKPGAGILYCLFCLGLAFIPRRMEFGRLLALSAAVLVGTQLVLAFAGGTYIGFYLALVIVTLFGCSRREKA
jgi:hypothetical protein